MLLLLVLSLLIFDGHASLPPGTQTCRFNFERPFGCHIRPLPSSYIYIQRTELSDPVNGTQSPFDIINAYSSFVVDEILPDMCSYFKSVSSCMKARKGQVRRACMNIEPHLIGVHQAYQNLTSAFCDHLTPDVFRKMIECGNDDNSLLATFTSCMYGAYNYVVQHKNREKCSVIPRFRDCLLQFEDCAPSATWSLVTVLNGNQNDMCLMLKQMTNGRSNNVQRQ
ncbi:uncharacterized protein LOC127709932 [Mytilus californianus]|uniref:uncharacterized protein LOC127709932 n=1 Tax=Mytilus californianus TaxID=6549 RepID=UPI0022460D3F|nr:uncharacterized protein LOC127709932 [Mytilus californianus]